MPLIFLFILLFCRLDAMPWGKDADIARFESYEVIFETGDCTPLEDLAIYFVKFHKKVISPADGPRSHFKPNSSQYMIDAIEKYGFVDGVPMGCDRLMRENSEKWIYPIAKDEKGCTFKYDPVK